MTRKELIIVVAEAVGESEELFQKQWTSVASPQLCDYLPWLYGHIADKVAEALQVTLEVD